MISAETVIAIHDEILATEPGLHGSYGIGPLTGAIGRVENAVQYDGLDDVYEIAAMYAVAIARGHVFNDANKRTALVTALVYLATQGIDIGRTPALEEIMVDVAQGSLDSKELGELLYSIESWAPYVDEKTELSLSAAVELQILLADIASTLEVEGVTADASKFHASIKHAIAKARAIARNFEKARWAAAGGRGSFDDWLLAQGNSDLVDA